jgi:hypothetical protein
LFVKITRSGAGKRSHDAPNLPVLEENSQLTFARPAVVADDGEISRYPETRRRRNRQT